MLKRVKELVCQLLYGSKSRTEALLNDLKKAGADIGEDVHLFGSFNSIKIDKLNPYLIKIGNHVNMVAVRILTHDYAWSVVKRRDGVILGNQRPVTIGDNVFVGADTVILGGTTIGDNVIIGAKSVVSGTVESNSVYAGNPARKIMSLDAYKEKREKRQREEAMTLFRKYYEAHGTVPPEEQFHEYFFLFTKDPDRLNPVFDKKLELCGNYEASKAAWKAHQPPYESYEAFAADCLAQIKREGGTASPDQTNASA